LFISSIIDSEHDQSVNAMIAINNFNTAFFMIL
jgi:hypothetical protein